MRNFALTVAAIGVVLLVLAVRPPQPAVAQDGGDVTAACPGEVPPRTGRESLELISTEVEEEPRGVFQGKCDYRASNELLTFRVRWHTEATDLRLGGCMGEAAGAPQVLTIESVRITRPDHLAIRDALFAAATALAVPCGIERCPPDWNGIPLVQSEGRGRQVLPVTLPDGSSGRLEVSHHSCSYRDPSGGPQVSFFAYWNGFVNPAAGELAVCADPRRSSGGGIIASSVTHQLQITTSSGSLEDTDDLAFDFLAAMEPVAQLCAGVTPPQAQDRGACPATLAADGMWQFASRTGKREADTDGVGLFTCSYRSPSSAETATFTIDWQRPAPDALHQACLGNTIREQPSATRMAAVLWQPAASLSESGARMFAVQLLNIVEAEAAPCVALDPEVCPPQFTGFARVDVHELTNVEGPLFDPALGRMRLTCDYGGNTGAVSLTWAQVASDTRPAGACSGITVELRMEDFPSEGGRYLSRAHYADATWTRTDHPNGILSVVLALLRGIGEQALPCLEPVESPCPDALIGIEDPPWALAVSDGPQRLGDRPDHSGFTCSYALAGNPSTTIRFDASWFEAASDEPHWGCGAADPRAFYGALQHGHRERQIGVRWTSNSEGTERTVPVYDTAQEIISRLALVVAECPPIDESACQGRGPVGGRIIGRISGAIDAEVLRAGATQWVPLRTTTVSVDSLRFGPGVEIVTFGPTIAEGDAIRTSHRGRARLRLFAEPITPQDLEAYEGPLADLEPARGDAVIRLRSNTLLCLHDFVVAREAEEAARPWTEVLRGSVRTFINRLGATRIIRCGTSLVGIRGTDFVASYDPESGRAAYFLNDGEIDVTAEGVTVRLVAGEEIFVTDGEPPGEPATMDGERWAALTAAVSDSFAIVVGPPAPPPGAPVDSAATPSATAAPPASEASPSATAEATSVAAETPVAPSATGAGAAATEGDGGGSLVTLLAIAAAALVAAGAGGYRFLRARRQR